MFSTLKVKESGYEGTLMTHDLLTNLSGNAFSAFAIGPILMLSVATLGAVLRSAAPDIEPEPGSASDSS